MSPAQREILQQALADAIYYRDVPLNCANCDASPPGTLCTTCEATLARARSYLTLGRQLGVESSAAAISAAGLG